MLGMMKRWRDLYSALPWLRLGRRGTAALEFAMVMPPFLLLCFGFIGTNAALMTRSSAQNSAQVAASLMATGKVTNFATGPITGQMATATTTCSGSLATTTVEYWACQGLPSWATFSVTASRNCSVPSVTVRTIASGFNQTTTGDVFGVLLGRTMTVTVVMMKQGTCE